jgi:hypothetical protein
MLENPITPRRAEMKVEFQKGQFKEILEYLEGTPADRLQEDFKGWMLKHAHLDLYVKGKTFLPFGGCMRVNGELQLLARES